MATSTPQPLNPSAVTNSRWRTLTRMLAPADQRRADNPRHATVQIRRESGAPQTSHQTSRIDALALKSTPYVASGSTGQAAAAALDSDVTDWFERNAVALEEKARAMGIATALVAQPSVDFKPTGPIPEERILASDGNALFTNWTSAVRMAFTDAMSSGVAKAKAHVLSAQDLGEEIADYRQVLQLHAVTIAPPRERRTLSYRRMLHWSAYWPMMLLMVAVDFIANLPVFAALLPSDPGAQASYDRWAAAADRFGLLAGSVRIVGEVAFFPAVSIFAIGVVLMLIMMGHYAGAAARPLFTLRRAGADMDGSIRAHQRVWSAVLVAAVAGVLCTTSVLYIARGRIVQSTSERLAADSIQATDISRIIDIARQARDLAKVSRNEQAAADVALQMDRDRKQVEFAHSISGMNLPILFLNWTLVIAAALLAYLKHSDTVDADESVAGPVTSTELRQKLREVCGNLRAEVSAARQCMADARYLSNSRPLATYPAKSQRMYGLIQRFRSENTQFRHMTAESIPAFQIPVDLGLPDVDDVTALPLPEGLHELEALCEMLSKVADAYLTPAFSKTIPETAHA